MARLVIYWLCRNYLGGFEFLKGIDDKLPLLLMLSLVVYVMLKDDKLADIVRNDSFINRFRCLWMVLLKAQHYSLAWFFQHAFFSTKCWKKAFRKT